MKYLPDVVYIPFNPDDPTNFRERKELLQEFINDGWNYMGSTRLIDPATNDEIYVYILTKY